MVLGGGGIWQVIGRRLQPSDEINALIKEAQESSPIPFAALRHKEKSAVYNLEEVP